MKKPALLLHLSCTAGELKPNDCVTTVTVTCGESFIRQIAADEYDECC